MKYKIIILILLFYFLVLLQNSFFIHLNIYGASPDLVLILVCLVSFFFSRGNVKLESGKNNYSRDAGMLLIIFAGILADIFSSPFFGISIVSFLAVYFLIKKSVGLLRDVSGQYQIIYFLPIFVVSLALYNFLIGVPSYFRGPADFYFFSNPYLLLANMAYNLVFAIIGFYIFKLTENGL